MGHFRTGKTRFEKTPKEWLPIGGQLGEITNQWADRDDIVAFVGEGAGAGVAAACFVPAIAEMEINVDAAFGEGASPEWIPDLRERDNQFDYPQVMGAVLHEAMHAKHSIWSLEELARHKQKVNRNEGDLVEWFEETRIEKRGVETFPKNRAFLRTCAMKLSIGDLLEEKEEGEDDPELAAYGIMHACKLILLSLARVDAGVLDENDVKVVKTKAIAVFGEELLEKLRDVWVRAQNHRDDTTWEPLLKLAKEWLKLLEDAGHKTEPEEMSEEEKQALKDLLGEMMKAMEEAAEDAETRGHGEAVEQSLREDAEAAAERAEAAARENSDFETSASEVFGKGTGPSSDRRTSSRLLEQRQPTGPERAAAVTVAKMLDRARYRDRVEVQRRSVMPPGKLSGRAAMQQEIERSRGQIMRAEPWKSKRRFHTEDPELKVGVLVDISGSMSGAMQPMAVTAWMLSEAVRRVQGKAAMVYYGSGVFPVLSPGQHLDQVNVYTAPDATERFDLAFKALQGKLDLLNSSGARLLVIVSDMCYTGNEMERTKYWIKRAEQAGVGVISMPFGNRAYVDAAIGEKGHNVKVLETVTRPADAALEIGKAAAEALEQAGNRR